METYITREERVKAFAMYFIENEATVRKVAKVFRIGKTTVHNEFM